MSGAEQTTLHLILSLAGEHYDFLLKRFCRAQKEICRY